MGMRHGTTKRLRPPCNFRAQVSRSVKSRHDDWIASHDVVNVALAALLAVAALWALAYHRAAAPVWTAVIAAGLAVITGFAWWPPEVIAAAWVVLVIGALTLNPTPIRRALLARPLLGIFR